MTLSAILLLAAATAAPAPDYDGVLLDFTATWCGPCRQVKPIVERLERQGYPIRTVDIDRNAALAKRFGINAVPTFVLVVNGQEAHRVSGSISESTMRRLMARIPAAVAEKTRETASDSPKPESTGAKLKRFLLPLSKSNDAVAERKSPPAVIRANNNPAGTQPVAEIPNDPLVASVRIRVRDGKGINYGSGTVIDSRAGRSLILTCGHIFRGVPKNAVVEVDRFEGSKAVKYTARILGFDLKADVGLASIATTEPVPIAPLAPVNGGPQRGNSLLSIGCGGGSRPLKIPVRVTGVNAYLGPGNLECTGMPKQGRSGGGLFDQSGRLVGVCFAAEPKNRRGLYASLQPVYELLKKAGMQIRSSQAEPLDTRLAAAGTSVPSQGSSENPGMSDQFAADEDRRGNFEDAADTHATADRGEEIQIDQRQLALMQVPLRGGNQSPRTGTDGKSSAPFPPVKSDVAAPKNESPLNRIDDVFGKAGEAEVICVIRRLDDPRAASKVIIINRASAKFVRYLQNETQSQPRKTAKYAQPASDETREELTTPFRTMGDEAVVGNETGRYRRSRATLRR